MVPNGHVYSNLQTLIMKKITGCYRLAKSKLLALAITLFFCSIGQEVLAQTVSGTIRDASGIEVIGANILVQGTDVGTLSDIDGSYSITMPSGSNRLVVSYLGYKTEVIDVNGRSTIDVVMADDAELLDEVVVVGYGVQRKSDLVGSVASLDGGDIQALVTGNPTSALQGKMAGIQVENNGGAPGGASNLYVRGVSSLTNSFPLYVIDGTFAEDMRHLNPKDIESIEVLKDAASAAIYGSRAANGVVIVTTKRGDDDGKTRVSLDLRTGIEAPTKMLDLLDGPGFVQYRNQLNENDGSGLTLNASDFANTDWQDLSLTRWYTSRVWF